MDARTLDIKTIFGQERRHVVPLFQRPYVWERESQLEPLWEDIRAVAERQLAGQPVRAHFLGAIVLDQVPKPTGQVEVRLVIDGQQRLTTVQIVFEAFADYCKEQGKDKHYAMLQKLVRNDNQFSTDQDEQFKVWPTTQDQGTFRKVMDCGSPKELRHAFDVKREDGLTEQPIGDAYLYFFSAIAAWVDSPVGAGGTDARLDALFKTLRENVRLVVIDLDPKGTRARLIHTMGNLTLLTKKLNPSVSNGAWEKKRDQIIKHSILRLNNVLAEHDEWNERLIRKRGENLLKLFKEVWPRP